MINSQDIASVDVAKRCVICCYLWFTWCKWSLFLLTTKLGKPGKTNITLLMSMGMQKIPQKNRHDECTANLFSTILTHTIMPWVLQALVVLLPIQIVRPTKNTTIFSDFTDPNFLAKSAMALIGKDIAFRSAPSSNYQLSISGGS